MTECKRDIDIVIFTLQPVKRATMLSTMVPENDTAVCFSCLGDLLMSIGLLLSRTRSIVCHHLYVVNIYL